MRTCNRSVRGKWQTARAQPNEQARLETQRPPTKTEKNALLEYRFVNYEKLLMVICKWVGSFFPLLLFFRSFFSLSCHFLTLTRAQFSQFQTAKKVISQGTFGMQTPNTLTLMRSMDLILQFNRFVCERAHFQKAIEVKWILITLFFQITFSWTGHKWPTDRLWVVKFKAKKNETIEEKSD